MRKRLIGWLCRILGLPVPLWRDLRMLPLPMFIRARAQIQVLVNKENFAEWQVEEDSWFMGLTLVQGEKGVIRDKKESPASIPIL